MASSPRIRALINRLARLDAAAAWQDDLNPSQRAVLAYLGQANRFSRAPSHVAEYLGTTRGTASQTLKALIRKGYVTETRSETDKRSVSIALTDTGRAVSRQAGFLDEALARSGDPENLEAALERLLRAALMLRGDRMFGLCRDCRHFEPAATGGTCSLLSVRLAEIETAQICHEQQPRQPDP